jgi:hypothetical protein
MNKYRLKPEAVPFFKESIATHILSLEDWSFYNVERQALEEVKDVYLTYGHKDKENKSSSLGGWGKDDGTHFYFTIHFPSVKFSENDKFSNGKVVRELMDKIQRHLNYFQAEYTNGEKE